MANLWLRIKVWFKVTVAAAIVIYIILFVFFNASGEKVPFWYWYHREPSTTPLVLMLCSFLAGVVASLLLGTTIRTVRQIQDMKERSRAQRLDRQIADIHSKAAMLQTKPASPETVEPPKEEKI